MAAKLSLILCLLAVFAVNYAHSAGSSRGAPAPAVDCSSLILSMADCLSFVSNGSTVSKPEGTCCTGLKTVLKADAACLCEAFRSSAQLGVVLNVTKATSLPQACKVSAPSATNCGLSDTPTSAPALSPGLSETSPTSASSAPELGPGASNDLAPSPSPGSSGSSMLSISFGSLLVGVLVASVSSF
ncbi:hypothetical protein UlMin_032698 [Ulmus minor]